MYIMMNTCTYTVHVDYKYMYMCVIHLTLQDAMTVSSRLTTTSSLTRVIQNSDLNSLRDEKLTLGPMNS